MSSIDPLLRQYLDTMGIEVWSLRSNQDDIPQGDTSVMTNNDMVVDNDAPSHAISKGMDGIEKQVRQCTACALHNTRTQTVFGVGNPQADWLLIGEAPGREEDRQGIPFVGRAGQLLTAMLHAISLNRDEVYIANVLKCRPPNNRDPLGKEVVKCEPFLHKQVGLIQPKIIIAMGRFAAQSLLKTTASIGRLRGRRHVYGDTDIPLIVTYHPAYLLRNPVDKRKSWEDLQLAKLVITEINGSTSL